AGRPRAGAAFPAAVAAALAGLSGRRRALAAMGLGAVAALAMPPAYAVPLLLVAFPGLLWLLDGARNARQAFGIGWCFGFGLFVVGLYWVAFALTVDLAAFFWLIPFAVAGLPALLAVFPAAAVAVLHATGLQGLSRLAAFAVLWAGAEYLRGHALTGFPWHLIGYGWVAWTPVLQSVAWIGIYGLSFLTVAVAALPAAFADPYQRRPAAVTLGLGLALFAAIGGLGGVRLAGATAETVPGVVLRLVQPNIDQRDKWDPELRQEIFRKHLELSASAGWQEVTHILWPETAVPYLVNREPTVREAIARVTPSDGLVITGAPRLVENGGPRQIFNSLVAVDRGGAVVATYDKFHLVPFGEYVPFRRWLPIDKVTPGQLDFSPGPGPRSLAVAGLPPFSPLICYEAIFPGAVTDPANRPAWLLNITNDAWYGETAGPHQHFAIARARAVEEGLPLVRVATTGISGVVDAHGRIVGRLDLGRQGILDSSLPVAIAPTAYARYGDAFFFGLLALGLVFAVVTRRLKS
ncbi:MAG TPA: apolipoprotein N-acyltransferase, partial [Alphaproteobacteria bacterium]|nr:apolipoprotein N-acyltransferase [Alphaproteobacteria bacterium]